MRPWLAQLARDRFFRSDAKGPAGTVFVARESSLKVRAWEETTGGVFQKGCVSGRERTRRGLEAAPRRSRSVFSGKAFGGSTLPSFFVQRPRHKCQACLGAQKTCRCGGRRPFITSINPRGWSLNLCNDTACGRFCLIQEVDR